MEISSTVETIHIPTKRTEHWIETETLVDASSQIDDLGPLIEIEMESLPWDRNLVRQ